MVREGIESPPHNKNAAHRCDARRFAERGGFEPPVPIRVRQFSKLVVSATHPSFLWVGLLLLLPNALQR